MTQQELDKIVERHKHWLKQDCEGWEDMKADLRGVNLRGVNLYGVNLYGVNLYGADLDEKERYRLGQILKEPITGYKKTAEGVVITAENRDRRLQPYVQRGMCEWVPLFPHS